MRGLGNACLSAIVALCSGAALGLPQGRAQPVAQDGIRLGTSDRGGIVRSANGPEAGVWVIAETTDLPTRMIRIVVTDDKGRYVVPDLPEANYSVWVRGFGLVDSPRMTAKPGKRLDLSAAIAPNAAAAAEYYPAIHWYSMLAIPPASGSGCASGRGAGKPGVPSTPRC